jgi:hypothetical protein
MAAVVPPNPLPPDESVGGILLILTCTLTCFTIITTVLRLWVRWGRRALGWVRPVYSLGVSQHSLTLTG